MVFAHSENEKNHPFASQGVIQLHQISSSEPVFCLYCGKKNKFFHQFCYNCGASLRNSKDIIRHKLIHKKDGKKYHDCPNCREKMEITYRYCSFCGTEIKHRTRHVSKVIKKVVWIRDGGKCVYCGSQDDLQFDHIIPFSKGGANSVKNIQVLCGKCNRKKYDKIDG